MHHPTSHSSPVSQALAALLQPLDDDDFGLTPCQTHGTHGNCPVAPGIEHVFVAGMANAAFLRVRQDNRAAEFHQFIYSPHSTIEKKCGFDLSIGHYQQPCRVRLMHKLLHFRSNKRKWCDEDWKWSSRSERHNHKHLEILLSNFEERHNKGRYEPFVVINTCYCIHEYRRMGCEHEGVRIPGFDDYRRTAVIDLRPIITIPDWRELLRNAEARIVANHEPHSQAILAHVIKGKEVIESLPVLRAGQLLEHIAERVRRTTCPLA